jgi:hypothetical protein
VSARKVTVGRDPRPQSPARSEGPTRTALSGRRLTIARAACMAVALLAVTLFIVGLVPAFEEFRTLSVYENAGDREITRANLAQLGLSVEFYATYWLTLGAILAVICFALAAVILWRKSEEPMALFVVVMLALLGVSYSGSTLALDDLNPVLGRVGVVLEELNTLFLFLFFFLFPDGRFVPRWTRYVAAVLVVVAVPSALFPNSVFGTANWSGLFYLLTLSGWIFVGVFAQIYRYRRVSSPTERQQTKLVVFGFTVALAGFAGIVAFGTFFPALAQFGSMADLLVAALGSHFFLLFIPLSIGIAIMRSRLWAIDIIINRTLVYGALTVILGLLYYLGIVLLQAPLSDVIAQGSQLAATASTLAVVALFMPLRRRIQRFIDRLFFRTKYDARKTLEAFEARVREEGDLQKLSEALVEVVDETMKPSHVSLWLRPPPTRRK